MVSISIKSVSDSSISCFHKMTINQDQLTFISHTVDISQNKAYHIQEYLLLQMNYIAGKYKAAINLEY
jgi:hypothetical protein